MQNLLTALGGRKFVFAEVLTVLLAIMIIAKVDLEMIKTFFNYAITIFGIFVGGNVAQKFSTNSVEPEEIKQ
jgi:general stress protein CsbA